MTDMLVRLPGIILCVAVACRADTYLEALKLSHEKKGHYFYKQPTEEMPQISSSLFPHSLDILVLLGKILLKLIIFKLFVKFFALICLLLFVPTLKLVHSEKPAKEEERRGLLNYFETHLRESAEKYKKRK